MPTKIQKYYQWLYQYYYWKYNVGTLAEEPQMLKCICYRAQVEVFCDQCPLYFYKQLARVRRPCPAHPHRQFKNDLVKCPRCYQSNSLKEIINLIDGESECQP